MIEKEIQNNATYNLCIAGKASRGVTRYLTPNADFNNEEEGMTTFWISCGEVGNAERVNIDENFAGDLQIRQGGNYNFKSIGGDLAKDKISILINRLKGFVEASSVPCQLVLDNFVLVDVDETLLLDLIDTIKKRGGGFYIKIR